MDVKKFEKNIMTDVPETYTVERVVRVLKFVIKCRALPMDMFKRMGLSMHVRGKQLDKLNVLKGFNV